jgi:prepilin-type N-terminal cleavage/methylation domain-containing protein
MTPSRLPRRCPGGFTLIEAMVSLAILALFLLGIAWHQMGSAHSVGHARHVSDATNLAQHRLEEMLTFGSRGTSRAQGTFVLCVDAELASARVIGVRYVGRIRRGLDADRDGTPENLDGTEITSCETPP